ncbi:MAG: amidohydrolase [Acidimicrobiaceae bacterium]|jgi:predicted TIM-barrel fold metal-dependent hydrolase|nr:amidohydrolase [Acidimicrobiaceae bacterium]
MQVNHPIISADSHIAEAPNTYTDYIDPQWRDVAPHVVETEDKGDLYVIDGMKRTINMGLIAAAGQAPEELKPNAKWEELPRSGWDSDYRLADQNRDGVSAEVIYPSVGMVLCNHPDADYKKAVMDAYNRWISDYCSVDLNRLLPIGQTPLRSVEEGIAQLEAMKNAGLRGVMMPGNPATDFDYDDPRWDPFWQTAIELEFPLSWHILTAKGSGRPRGPKANAFMTIIRANQDIMGTLVFGGVFERNPGLRVVCVEADAGWVPHYMYRMDHAYKRHRYWLPPGQELSKLPSEYFSESIYTTFQDDWVAFKMIDHVNHKRLLWANDFPHSDSTWPWSQELLDEHAAELTTEQTSDILCNNVAELYGIDTSELPIGGDSLAATV